MKRNFFRGLLVSFAGAVLAAGAFAGESDRLVVNIPYAFVVSGRTLPAGNYRVSRISTTDLHQLLLSSVENHESIIALSTQIASAQTQNPAVTFQVSGAEHLLTSIQTEEHVFTFPVATRPSSSKNGFYTSGTSESTKP